MSFITFTKDNGKAASVSAADPLPVDIAAGDSIAVSVPPRTPTTTSVASSATSVTILASNANRRGLLIFNDSTALLRLSVSTPATQANSLITMAPGSTLLLDHALIFTGTIYGIWTAANGTAQVTEFVV